MSNEDYRVGLSSAMQFDAEEHIGGYTSRGSIGLGYPNIALEFGLPPDTDPKTIKREALSFMHLLRPRERVFDTADTSSIINFAQQIVSSGSKAIWVPVDNKAGGHIPNVLDLNNLPREGRVRIMEQAHGPAKRPLRIAITLENGAYYVVDVEYGNEGREAGRTFEGHKYPKGVVDPNQDIIVSSNRFVLNRQFRDSLLQALPPADIGPGSSRELFASEIVSACNSMRKLHERLSSLPSVNHKPLVIGVEGYIHPNGKCVFVDADFPSEDGSRWLQEKF